MPQERIEAAAPLLVQRALKIAPKETDSGNTRHRIRAQIGQIIKKPDRRYTSDVRWLPASTTAMMISPVSSNRTPALAP